MYQPTFIEVSHNISVEVKPTYLEDESSPLANKHVFAYYITIRNLGNKPVQLLKRHWVIKGSGGEHYEVEGEGVIGLQPLIAPDETHEYNSFCVLKSYRGSMEGFYSMQKEDDEGMIRIRIPKFLLISHLLN